MSRTVVSVSLLAFSLSWVAVARAKNSQVFSVLGVVAGAASWCVATGSIENPTDNVWRWLPTFAVAAAAWRFLAHSYREERVIWERAFAVAAAVLFGALFLTSASVVDRGSWIRTALIMFLAALVVYDIPTLRKWPANGSDVARALAVGSSWLLGGWYVAGDTASVALLSFVTVIGAVVAVVGASRSTNGLHHDTFVWLGIHGGASIAAVMVFGWPSATAVFVLLVVAASTVSFGVLSGSRRWTMAGIEGFVVIAAALLWSDGDITYVSGAVVGSIAVLIATETERVIAAARDQRPESWVRSIEWLALLAVPAVSVAAALGDLGYLVVLAGFGTAALLFGILTQVRRRVFVGALAIAAAVVLAVATPLAEAVAVGMATAGAVGITFAIGVLVIVVAILIERYQQSAGMRLARLTDAMDGWD
jgi:hypothetical protein